MLRFAPLVLLLAAAPQGADSITVTTAEETHHARNLSIKELSGALIVEFENTMRSNRKESVKAMDVVEIGLAPAGSLPTAPPADMVEIVTTTGDSIYGTLGAAEEGVIHLTSAALGETSFKFDHILDLRFVANRATWPAKAPEKRDCDIIVSTSQNRGKGSLKTVSKAGVVYFSAPLERNVTTSLANVAVVHLMDPQAAPPQPPKSLYSIIVLTDGSSLQGTIASYGDGALKFTDLYGTARTLNAAAVAGIYFKNGRVVYLSDLPVARAVENANYIDFPDPREAEKSKSRLVYPYRRDRNAYEKPLRIRGTAYRKGLGVHAMSELAFDLGGQYGTFQAHVGIDDVTSGLGNVTFEVVADGRSLYTSGPKTAKDKAEAVSVPVAGVKELVLKVSFGDDGAGAGDVANWANARVIR